MVCAQLLKIILNRDASKNNRSKKAVPALEQSKILTPAEERDQWLRKIARNRGYTDIFIKFMIFRISTSGLYPTIDSLLAVTHRTLEEKCDLKITANTKLGNELFYILDSNQGQADPSSK